MTSPRTLLQAWDVPARKNLGQHFLADSAVAESIVAAAAITAADVVLEIGAGLGALTIPAARVAKHVCAVEKDPRLVELLKTELALYRLANVTVLEADILSVDLQQLADRFGAPRIVLGNLPYNISSQILVRLIQQRHGIRLALLMFQKELAQRLRASPGGREYGRLSVMLQYCAAVRTRRIVEAKRFFPRPKVDSEVLEIRFLPLPPARVPDEGWFFQVIKAAFGQRRKTLKNALTGSDLGLSARQTGNALTAAGIDPKRRAETLSVEEFVALSNALCRELR
jgi:16S rRNA (adenine1518-N6/adenine1519-N6)-dimethyltransferase